MQEKGDKLSHVSENDNSSLNYSIDEVLGGAIRLKQPLEGYRMSMDTVLLAAAIPAQAGDKILEAGIGTGGASLCLAHRIKDTHITGLELQSEMAALAKENVLINDMADRVDIVEGNLIAPPKELKAGSFDHVFANPPYLDDGTAIRSPNTTKGLAHMEKSASLKNWVNFCVNMVRHKGSISFIYRADRMDELISRLHRGVGELAILPIRPRVGEVAKRVIIQGRKGVSGAARLLPGLILHGIQEHYTGAAEAIVRDGDALELGTIKPMKDSSHNKI